MEKGFARNYMLLKSSGTNLPDFFCTLFEKMLAINYLIGYFKNMNTTLDLGNNETISKGIFPQNDGTFLAMTFTQSKFFKTRKGAEKWLAKKTKN